MCLGWNRSLPGQIQKMWGPVQKRWKCRNWTDCNQQQLEDFQYQFRPLDIEVIRFFKTVWFSSLNFWGWKLQHIMNSFNVDASVEVLWCKIYDPYDPRMNYFTAASCQQRVNFSPRFDSHISTIKVIHIEVMKNFKILLGFKNTLILQFRTNLRNTHFCFEG